MADLEKLVTALRKADAAGNVEDAKAIAGMIQRARAATPSPTPEPGFLDQMKAVADANAGAQQPDVEFVDRYNKMSPEEQEEVKGQAKIALAIGSAVVAPIAAAELGGATVAGYLGARGLTGMAARGLLGAPVAAATSLATESILPTENPLQTAAMDAGLALAGEPVIRGAVAVAKPLLRPVVKAAAPYVEKVGIKAAEVTQRLGERIRGAPSTAIETAKNQSRNLLDLPQKLDPTNKTNKALEDYAQTFSKGHTREEVGELVQNTLSDKLGSFETSVRGAYEAVDSVMNGQTVSLTPLKAQAKKLMGAIEEGGIGEGKAKTLLNEILGKPEGVSFRAAQRLRSSLLEEVRSVTEPLGNQAKREFSSLASMVDESMESTANAVGGQAKEAWRNANELYRSGAEKYQSSLIKGIIKAQPEQIGDMIIKANKPGTIRQLKGIINDDESWKKVQGAFLDRLLWQSFDDKTGTITASKLSSKLRSFGNEALDELLGPNRAEFEAMLKKHSKAQMGKSTAKKVLATLTGAGPTSYVIYDFLKD